jgi:hypothetical protein
MGLCPRVRRTEGNKMDEVTRVIARALAADPAARDTMHQLVGRLAPNDGRHYASATLRARRLHLLREDKELRGVRTALVVYAAEHAPPSIEGYGPLLAWGVDRANWREVACLASSRQSARSSQSRRERIRE